MNKNIVFLSALLLVLLICSVSFAKEFTDVPSTHWASKYISHLSDRGVINGYDDETFRPSKQITRAEFIKLIVSESYLSQVYYQDLKDYAPNYGKKWWDLYYDLIKDIIPYDYTTDIMNLPISRVEVANILNSCCKKDGFYVIEKEPDDPSSEDIEKQYAANKQVLYEMGITKSVNISNEEMEKAIISKIPQERMSEFFEKYEELVPTKEKYPYNVIVNTFDDVNQFEISDQLAVSNVSRLGLMIGYDDGSFKPENYMTRAEVATIIYRYADLKEAQ